MLLILSALCYVLSFPIFCSKIVLFPCHAVVMCWCILSRLANGIVSFLLKVLFFRHSFILPRYLFSLPSFASTFWFISLSCLFYLLGYFFLFVLTCSSVIPLSLSSWRFLIYVFSLLLDSGFEFLFVFCWEQRFYHSLILLLCRLVHLTPWWSSLGYVLIICLIFSVSALTVFQCWFLNDVNLVFFSDIILFNFSIIISSCVSICSVWFGCMFFRLLLLCGSIRLDCFCFSVCRLLY